MGSNDELIDTGGTNFRKAFALFNTKVETPQNGKVRRNFVVSKFYFLNHVICPLKKSEKRRSFVGFFGK